MCALALVAYVVVGRDGILRISRFFMVFVAAVATISLVLLSEVGLPVVDRLMMLGSDPGSLARLGLWRAVPQVVAANPFGHGVLSGVSVLEREFGFEIANSNLHNIVLQYLVDLGVAGCALLLCLIAFVSWDAVRAKGKSVLVTMLLFYFVAGMFQFRGYDPLMFMFLGFWASKVYDCSKNADAVRASSDRRGDRAPVNVVAAVTQVGTERLVW